MGLETTTWASRLWKPRAAVVGVALWGSALSSLAGGCGAAPQLGSALGEDYTEREGSACTDAGGQLRPLVVDWDSTDRTELEARASRGVVVVKYDDCKMEVLKRCEVRGTPAYDYISVTPKQDVVSMRDASEVHANIPVYAAKFEGKLAHSGSLDVAMTIVGQFDSAAPVASLGQLEGECDGATHVVTALTVGAFEFFATNDVSGEASAEIMGAGVGAKESQRKELLNKDGDSESCAAAESGAASPPFGCGALLRVELVALGTERAEEPSCPVGMAWDGAQCVAVDTSVSCGADEVPDKEKGCIAKKEEAVPTRVVAGKSGVHVAPVASTCATIPECAEACDGGDGKACLGLGALYREHLSPGQPHDDGKRAAAAFEEACGKKEGAACTALGEMQFQGLGIKPDKKAAIPNLERGCDLGDPAGCNDMGLAMQMQGDTKAAAGYFSQACKPGESLGCLNLGLMYKSGQGVPKDLTKARQYVGWACDAKVGNACEVLSKM